MLRRQLLKNLSLLLPACILGSTNFIIAEKALHLSNKITTDAFYEIFVFYPLSAKIYTKEDYLRECKKWVDTNSWAKLLNTFKIHQKLQKEFISVFVSVDHSVVKISYLLSDLSAAEEFAIESKKIYTGSLELQKELNIFTQTSIRLV